MLGILLCYLYWQLVLVHYPAEPLLPIIILNMIYCIYTIFTILQFYSVLDKSDDD
jgi:hypothetical protein